MQKKLTYPASPNSFNINIEALNERFESLCVFDSNPQANKNKYIQTSKVIAVGSTRELILTDSKNTLEQLQKFYDTRKGWLFGYLSYDLKNEIEHLHSENPDGLDFPLLHFFAPKVVIQINSADVSVFYDDDFVTKTEAEEIYNLSINPPNPLFNGELKQINIKSKITKQEYIDSVTQLKQHIRKGDIYEVNFCQEFYAENIELNSVEIYEKLN